jgi:hypothetical protein
VWKNTGGEAANPAITATERVVSLPDYYFVTKLSMPVLASRYSS